jgi:Interferon-induced transmembrane protein
MSSANPVSPTTAPSATTAGESSHPGTASAIKPESVSVALLFFACLACVPLGAVALYYAGQMSSRLSGGDLQGAQASGNKARTWSRISIGLAVLSLLVLMSA